VEQNRIVRLEQVGYRYGSQPALAGVDLEIESGRITALLGPNGAGKTTLIHLLLGLIATQTGTLRLFDDLAPGDRACCRRCGVMLQASGVQHNLTVSELIALFASFYPAPVAAEALLAECGLQGLESRRFDRLSGGQQQRVLFALAVVGNPELLVLDEPTTGLDPAARRSIWAAIEARRAAGTAILLSTHFMAEAERLADRICVLDRGRVRASGSPDQIRRRVPRDTIRVRTALPKDRLLALPHVQHVQMSDSGAEILATRGTPALRALLAADPAIDGIEVRPADLETAFLALTDADQREAT